MSVSAALVCLVAVLALHIQTNLGSKLHEQYQHQHHHHHHRPRVHHVHKQEDNESTKSHGDDVSIDAFDADKCGEANLRRWQCDEIAFRCGKQTYGGATTSNSSKSSASYNDHDNVPFQGEPANAGEFPFFVNIKISVSHPKIEQNGTDGNSYCSGVLIHKDIVLTTATNCLMRSDSFGWKPLKLEIILGSTRFKPSQEDVLRSAKWMCSSSSQSANKNNSQQLAYDDLGVILLNEPVDYVPGKIGPACLASSEVLGSPTCALAAYCAPKDAQLPLDSRRHKEHLLTMPMHLQICNPVCSAEIINNVTIPYETCYWAQNGAGRCRNDSGDPVVCYDKCSKKNPDSVQAHVVGLMSQVGKFDTPDSRSISVIDLHKGRKRLMELLGAIRQENTEPSETISCRQIDAMNL